MHAARSSTPSPTGPSTPAGSVAAKSFARTVGRVALGAFLGFTGTAHLTVSRVEFQAQVPPWLPLNPDVVVVTSGVVEIALGAALLLAPRRHRWLVGWVVAAFFVAVFPGNISQYVTERLLANRRTRETHSLDHPCAWASQIATRNRQPVGARPAGYHWCDFCFPSKADG